MIRYFFINLVALANLFFFSKSNLSMVLFKYEVLELFDSHLFYSLEYIQNIHHYVIEKQKLKKINLAWMKK